MSEEISSRARAEARLDDFARSLARGKLARRCLIRHAGGPPERRFPRYGSLRRRKRTANPLSAVGLLDRREDCYSQTDTPLAPIDPVICTRAHPAAKRTPGVHAPTDTPAEALSDLLADLATPCRQSTAGRRPQPHHVRLTEPIKLHATALAPARYQARHVAKAQPTPNTHIPDHRED